MPEKIYIAASFEQRDEVSRLMDRLRAAGHTITADWTKHIKIASLTNSALRDKLKREYAVEDADGVAAASVYALLIGPRESIGARIELGIALGARVKKICLIGNPNETQVFYSHPAITVYPDVDSFVSSI